MSSEKSSTEQNLQRTGFLSIAIGVLAIVACELPILLAAIGFAGLGGALSWLTPSPIGEIVSMVLLVIGVIVLIYGYTTRRRSKMTLDNNHENS